MLSRTIATVAMVVVGVGSVYQRSTVCSLLAGPGGPFMLPFHAVFMLHKATTHMEPWGCDMAWACPLSVCMCIMLHGTHGV